MSKPKRHEVLVEITDYKGLTESRVKQIISRGIELALRESPCDWKNIQVKGLWRSLRKKHPFIYKGMS